MNVEARALFGHGERAAVSGEIAAARAAFIEAAQSAISVQLWRSAIRCYRSALELDLLDREVVQKVVEMPIRARSAGWLEYLDALCRHPDWTPFGCRSARVVIGDTAVVECPDAGPVLELVMPEIDRIELRPTARWSGMPIAIALIVVRRAMWPTIAGRGPDPRTLGVSLVGQPKMVLDEFGDWHPAVEDRLHSRVTG